MLAELKLSVKADKQKQEIGYYQSSNLQGVMMEKIDSEYADLLHTQGYNPYSQCILQNHGQYQNPDNKRDIVDGDKTVIWSIRTLDEKAYQNIIMPMLNKDFNSFDINKKNIHVEIMSKEVRTLKKQELLEEFYNGQVGKYLNIEFLTPTSFKSGGRYMIMPDLRLIYQSLMNKYSTASNDMDMYDEETLEQLVSASEITQYKLKSVIFPLEGVKIPSFKGTLTIRLKGTDTMARYARLLMRFGEFSGVGIKTAMGMGGLRLK